MGKFRLAVVSALVLIVLGCGGGGSAPFVPQSPDVLISPGDVELVLGGAMNLSLLVLNDSLEDETVTWESSNGAVVSVNSQGRITGLEEGSAIIRAVFMGVSGLEDSISVSVVDPVSTQNSVTGLVFSVNSVRGNSGLVDMSQVASFTGDAQDRPYMVFENNGGLGFLIPSTNSANTQVSSFKESLQPLGLSDVVGTNFTFGDLCVRSAFDAILYFADRCYTSILSAPDALLCDGYSEVPNDDIFSFVTIAYGGADDPEELIARYGELLEKFKDSSLTSAPDCFDPSQFQITPNSKLSFVGEELQFHLTGPSTGGIRVDTSLPLPWRVISNSDETLVTHSAITEINSTLQNGLSAVTLDTFELSPAGSEEYTVVVVVPLTFSGDGITNVQDFDYSVVATASLTFEALSEFL